MAFEFYSHRRKRRRKAIIIIVLLAIVVVIAREQIESISAGIGNIIWQGEEGITETVINPAVSALTTKESLQKANAELLRSIDRYKKYEIENAILKEENKRLREIASLQSVEGVDVVRVKILVKPPVSPYGSLILGSGSRDGRVRAEEVLWGEYTALGEIDEVFERSSRVRLYSDPGQEAEGLIGVEGLPLTLVGRGGGTYRGELPREIDVEIGDVVRKAGSERLILGTVKGIERSTSSTFQDIYIAVPVNIYELEYVDIIEG